LRGATAIVHRQTTGLSIVIESDGDRFAKSLFKICGKRIGRAAFRPLGATEVMITAA
jgi:hypothetical protein